MLFAPRFDAVVFQQAVVVEPFVTEERRFRLFRLQHLQHEGEILRRFVGERGTAAIGQRRDADGHGVFSGATVGGHADGDPEAPPLTGGEAETAVVERQQQIGEEPRLIAEQTGILIIAGHVDRHRAHLAQFGGEFAHDLHAGGDLVVGGRRIGGGHDVLERELERKDLPLQRAGGDQLRRADLLIGEDLFQRTDETGYELHDGLP